MDMTLSEAAEYLKDHGYTVARGRIGGRGPVKAETLKHWAHTGKIAARKSGAVWLVQSAELDRLIESQSK